MINHSSATHSTSSPAFPVYPSDLNDPEWAMLAPRGLVIFQTRFKLDLSHASALDIFIKQILIIHNHSFCTSSLDHDIEKTLSPCAKQVLVLTISILVMAKVELIPIRYIDVLMLAIPSSHQG